MAWNVNITLWLAQMWKGSRLIIPVYGDWRSSSGGRWYRRRAWPLARGVAGSEEQPRMAFGYPPPTAAYKMSNNPRTAAAHHTWPTSSAKKPLPIVMTAGQWGTARSSRPFLTASASPGQAAGGRAADPAGYWPTRPTVPAPTVAYLRRWKGPCTITEKADQIRYRTNKGSAAGRPAFDPTRRGCWPAPIPPGQHVFAASCRKRGVGFAFGFPVDERVQNIVDLIADQGWHQAVEDGGGLREGAWVA